MVFGLSKVSPVSPVPTHSVALQLLTHVLSTVSSYTTLQTDSPGYAGADSFL